MRIKKFFESDISDISPDRVIEINELLTRMISDISQKSESIDSLINELNNFRSTSKSNNDQIDDSVSNLEFIRNLFNDSVDKIDNVVSNMNDYNKNGRKFLY